MKFTIKIQGVILVAVMGLGVALSSSWVRGVDVSLADAQPVFEKLFNNKFPNSVIGFIKNNWNSFQGLINKFRLKIRGIGDSEAIEKAANAINAQLESFGVKLGQPIENFLVKTPKGFAKKFVANPEEFNFV
ncbi:MAG: hypothetical protein WD449_01675, partial [Candidatus Babeliales bacterium]